MGKNNNNNNSELYLFIEIETAKGHAIHATLLQQLVHPKVLLPDLENYFVGNSFFPQKLFILNQKCFHSGL